MKYLLCFLCPPLAVLLTGRPLSACVNALLTLCFWVPGVVHAVLVVNAERAEERHAETLTALTGKPVAKRKSEEVNVLALLAVVLGAVLIVGLLVAHSHGRAETPKAARAEPTPAGPFHAGAKHAAFIQIIREAYKVQSGQFVRADLLRVILPPGENDERGVCEEIANLWAVEGRQPARISVESWRGDSRTAVASATQRQLSTAPAVEDEANAVAPPQPVSAEEKEARNATALAAMEGRTFAEIVGTHGAALSKDPATGWAEFAKFRARFVGGKVAEVNVK